MRAYRHLYEYDYSPEFIMQIPIFDNLCPF